jgi:hypothetical protein
VTPELLVLPPEPDELLVEPLEPPLVELPPLLEPLPLEGPEFEDAFTCTADQAGFPRCARPLTLLSAIANTLLAAEGPTGTTTVLAPTSPSFHVSVPLVAV